MSRSIKQTVKKVEVKQTFEENLRQGIEIAGVLVDASKESPRELDYSSENEINNKHIEDDEEDTLEEAPSIVDEALGKRNKQYGEKCDKVNKKNEQSVENKQFIEEFKKEREQKMLEVEENVPEGVKEIIEGVSVYRRS